MAVLAEHPEWAHKVQYVGFREFNSIFPFWAPGDLVLHFPGTTTRQREWALKAIRAAIDPRNGELLRALPPILNPREAKGHLRHMDYRALNPHLYPEMAAAAGMADNGADAGDQDMAAVMTLP